VTDWLKVNVLPIEGNPRSEPRVSMVKLHCTVTVTELVAVHSVESLAQVV
jgi:hypothetical protein